MSVYDYPQAALLVLSGLKAAVGWMYGTGMRVWRCFPCPVCGVFALLASLAASLVWVFFVC
ncbi:MAG: hypothetical protein M0P39_05185 [Rhodocyclaceae bacterium]|nr:hypothetical protein [Rhodocyclaceae bacterium]